jgi:hypothetical protein
MMSSPKDYIGKVFGRLKVLSVHSVRNKRSYYECACNCGKTIVTRSDALKAGRTKSCGCLKKESSIQNGKNKRTHGMTNTRIHRIWLGVKSRCNNTNDTAFKDYGQKGITVCEEWENDFSLFLDWSISNGYNDGLTLDRKNPLKNYSPDNCRWATQKQQANNRTNNKHLVLKGIKRTVSEWEDISGVNRTTILHRYKKGLSDDEILQKVSK